MPRRARLAFALDVPDLAAALPLLDRVAPHVHVVKIGLELFVAEGPPAVAAVRERGVDIFLDLKLHDIPETVARAVGAAARLGVAFLTIHASGAGHMLRRAASEAGSMTLLGVTALTSLDDAALAELGILEGTGAWTDRLATLATQNGLRGLVCSPHEVGALRARLAPDVVLVTPGIRSADDAAGDQKRTATAGAAVRAGADLLVVGRPIRDAPDPAAAAARFRDELEASAV